MFKIRSSKFSNCKDCQLYNCHSCILETNCDDLSEVEIIFVAENPGKDEVNLEVPLIGRSGQVFRIPLKNYIISKGIKYLLTNVVLCQTINQDGTTGNPSQDVIERCKSNCFNIIRTCKPKLIVLMGTSAINAFGINEPITKIRGSFYKWEDIPALVTVHPSYVLRNQSNKDQYFEEIEEASKFIIGENKSSEDKISLEEKAPVFLKIPEKFYTNKYRLVDIQALRNNNKILFIFRDENNKKIYYTQESDYYCYNVNNKDSKWVESYENLIPVRIKYKDKHSLDPKVTYEGDIRIDNKYAVDYYLLNKEECEQKDLNIFYIDIEVLHTDKFPDPELAEFPINAISYEYHKKVISYILWDSRIKIKPTLKENITFVKSENELISRFLSDVNELDPDIFAGWNLGFDLLYIINRCSKLNIDTKKLSKYGEHEIDPARNYLQIVGKVCIDMCNLYKSFVQERKESYTLDFVAQEELGHSKVVYQGELKNLYFNDIDKFIEYNRTDVTLLSEIENKMKFIFLLSEIRQLCCTTYRSSLTTMGQVDSFILSYLKRKGLSPRNFISSKHEISLPGAYVKEPNSGIYNWIVDFDFKSLYPSLIITYNIGVDTFVFRLSDLTQGYDFIYDFDSFPEKVKIINSLDSNEEIEVSKYDVLKKFKDEKLIVTINGCFYKSHEDKISFLSEIVKVLMDARGIYKNKMFEAKNKFEESKFDMIQKAYKILANAFYGVLGNDKFRFFSPYVASSITLSGQEIAKTCILKANDFVQKIKEEKNKGEKC
jgi:uracil-DNA glycosylase family 4